MYGCSPTADLTAGDAARRETATAAAPPATTTPATPGAAAAASGAATTTALLFITDGSGRTIENVTVNVMGPVDREVEEPGERTDAHRRTARRHLSRALHAREVHHVRKRNRVARRNGGAGTVDHVERRAGAAAPPPPPPAPAPVGRRRRRSCRRRAAPKTVSLPDYIEKNFITGREPQKENLIGCSGVGQALLWQIRDPWNGPAARIGADGMIYVVGGEGRLKLGEREFTVVGRRVRRGAARARRTACRRSGRNPLIVLAVLAGAPCAAE